MLKINYIVLKFNRTFGYVLSIYVFEYDRIGEYAVS